jgi:beta-lactamase regulating signal transducer with metallopeptidase domain
MIQDIFRSLEIVAKPVSMGLIHSLWQGVIIALILAIALKMCYSARSSIRYGLSCIALLLIVVFPILTVVSPSLNPGIGYSMNSLSTGTSSGITESSQNNSYNSISEPQADTRGNEYSFQITEKSGIWIFLFWLFGTTLFLIYHLIGWGKTRKLVSTGSEPITGALRDKFNYICSELKVNNKITFLASTVVQVPCVIGWLNPVVLFPVSVISGLSISQLQLILTHELAHVRRLDVLLNYIQSAVETFLFFNPAVWWVSRQIRIERENCCDDLVVDLYGDRVAYARTLTEMESLRTIGVSMAVRADGASLVNRLRRLVGFSGRTRQTKTLSALTIMVITFVIGFAAATLSSYENSVVKSIEVDGFSVPQEAKPFGHWRIEDNQGEPLLVFRNNRGLSSFIVSIEFDVSSLENKKNSGFMIKREAGTIFCDGPLTLSNGEWSGYGKCFFSPNDSIYKELEKIGFGNSSSYFKSHECIQQKFMMTIHDVTVEYGNQMKKAGYGNMDISGLVAFRTHDITREYIDNLAKGGYKDISEENLIAMKIHGITDSYIDGFGKLGYNEIDIDQLIAMKIHDINHEYVREISKLGYKNVDIDNLIAMKIHGITDSYIDGFGKLGYNEIDIDQLIAMKIHDIDHEYVKEISMLGYKHIHIDDLIAMKIHGIDANFIREANEGDNSEFSIDELISMKIHGRIGQRSNYKSN